MKFFSYLTLLGLFILGVNGLESQRQVLITYPNDAPRSDLNEYKNAIEAAGGVVLHEFDLIKGFIVKASSQAINSINTLSQEFAPTIEDDQTVTTQEQE